MKTSQIPKEEIDNLKELLLANNSDSNSLGIVIAKTMGWEYCDIANFVIRNVAQLNYNYFIHYFDDFKLEVEYKSDRRWSRLYCKIDLETIDVIKHRYSLKPIHFDKACGTLIKELGKILEKKYKDV